MDRPGHCQREAGFPAPRRGIVLLFSEAERGEDPAGSGAPIRALAAGDGHRSRKLLEGADEMADRARKPRLGYRRFLRLRHEKPPRDRILRQRFQSDRRGKRKRGADHHRCDQC